MTPACPAPDPRLGLVNDLVASADCGVRAFAQSGYEALTQPPSSLPALITAALTLYVALLGWGLMTGRGPRLADTPQIAVKIGFVLALTASWPLFQALIFRTAFEGSDELARAITRNLPLQGGTVWSGLQTAYDQLVAAAAHYGREAGPEADPRQGGAALASESLWIASGALLASTVYVALAGKVMVGALAALGPLFVGLFLIPQTRGLTVGWIRALLAGALLPLVAALGCALLQVLLEPRLALIRESVAAGQLDLPQVIGATSLTLAGAAGALGLVAAVLIAAVSFRLAPPPASVSATSGARATAAPPAPASRAARVAAGVEAQMVRERMQQAVAVTLERRTLGPGPGPAASAPTSRHVRSAPIARRLRKDRLR
jgi:type IV secretion system protein VirB6